MAETWQTSVDQLTEAGRHLLERLAFLAPDPVPEFLLEVPVSGVEGEDAADALADLAAYSLVTRDPAGGTFVVHRLVQDVTRRGLAEAGTERQRLIEALSWMSAAFVGNAGDVRNWPRLAPVAPHAAAAARHADSAGIIEPTLELMGRLDMLLDARALHSRAVVYSRRALAIAEADFGPNDPRIATRLNNLAALLQATNRLGEAEPLMHRALAILLAFQRDTSRPHPHRDAVTRNYAGPLAATGKSEAEIHSTIATLYREAGLDKN